MACRVHRQKECQNAEKQGYDKSTGHKMPRGHRRRILFETDDVPETGPECVFRKRYDARTHEIFEIGLIGDIDLVSACSKPLAAIIILVTMQLRIIAMDLRNNAVPVTCIATSVPTRRFTRCTRSDRG